MSTIAKASGALAVGTTTLMGGKATLNSVQVVTDGTNAATVTVYDNTAGSGKILSLVKVVGTTLHDCVVYDSPLRGDVGLTVVVAGTGATAYVGYGA